MAGNIGCSIKKGQRVIVVGRLKMRSWEKDGRVYHDAEINAESVGHDLMWGTANFIRSSGTGIQAAAGSGAPGALGSGDGDDGGPQTQPGDTAGDTDGDAGGDDDGDGHATFINDASGEEEEVDQETGELKGAAA